MNHKTTRSQFNTMINFMEKNGDLSRPGDGASGKMRYYTMWNELVDLLNADTSGMTKSQDKWRKVWSDLKSYTKKKFQKYQVALKIDPKAQIKWVNIEKRVLPFVCGPKIRYSEADSSKTHTKDSDMQQDEMWLPENEDGDPAEDSAPDSPISLSPSAMVNLGSPWQSPRPQQSNTKDYSIVDALLELNRLTRENESNRDRMMYKLEKERQRQRDVELKLQEQWILFFNGALETVHTYLRTSKK